MGNLPSNIILLEQAHIFKGKKLILTCFQSNYQHPKANPKVSCHFNQNQEKKNYFFSFFITPIAIKWVGNLPSNKILLTQGNISRIYKWKKLILTFFRKKVATPEGNTRRLFVTLIQASICSFIFKGKQLILTFIISKWQIGVHRGFLSL